MILGGLDDHVRAGSHVHHQSFPFPNSPHGGFPASPALMALTTNEILGGSSSDFYSFVGLFTLMPGALLESPGEHLLPFSLATLCKASFPESAAVPGTRSSGRDGLSLDRRWA